MKYFTNKLWNKINSENEEERFVAILEWEKNSKEYEVAFELANEKLPKSFYEVYKKNNGFHDFHLKDFQIIHRDYGFGIQWPNDPIEVRILITNMNDQWEITYKGISKIIVDFKPSNHTFDANKGFDDYGYDEFLVVDNKTLSHEILFASGSTILICFTKITVSMPSRNKG